MNIKCLLGFHQWHENCERCSRCGKTRKNGHHLDGIVCTRCGQMDTACLERRRITVDLIALLKGQPMEHTVPAMFAFTRGSIGGRIDFVDLLYDGFELMNVPFDDECMIEIPSELESLPIRAVSLPNERRQRARESMRLRKK